MRALIVGGSGQLGTALRRSVPEGWTISTPNRSVLDLENADSIDTAVQAVKPDVVMHAAGFTDVEAAERDPALAMRINGGGAALLAAAARRYGARLIAVSTDYVFDGRATTPYAPDAPTNPLNAYGRSKLQGEHDVMERAPGSLVVRTSWLYGPTGRNFVRTMLNRMTAGVAVRVVNDQKGAPTSATTLSHALWRAAACPEVQGIHHVTDSGIASWYDFAMAIGAEAQQAGLLKTMPEIVPITSAEYSSATRRPAYSVLQTSGTAAALSLEPISWRAALRAVVGEMSQRTAA
jgi:dTDP-4-dehydrorhamnose reductase